MGWFSDQNVEEYNSTYGGWARPGAQLEYASDAGGVGGADDVNYEGASSDPFAYTKGTLLTPWERKFQAPAGSGGGIAVPEFKAFNYKDFDYRAAKPDMFAERYDNPGNFVYGDFQGPEPFKGVTEADMKADPGYQFRMQQGQKALEASKAAQGVLKSGGTAKALQKYGQEYGSQEYGNVYGRKAAEHDRTYSQARDQYSINRGNAAENWDRNIGNARTAYQIRQGAWKDNAAVELDASRHGYDVATGSWDRNYAKDRQAYDDEAQHRAAQAAAANAGASRDYDRAWREYTDERDTFWTNQDRQYAMLDREANRGWNAAYAYGTTQADLALGRGNAQASGRVGAANAWTGAMGNIGQGWMDAGMIYAGSRTPRTSTPTRTAYPYA
jgi:hypothetical protein